MKPVFVLFLTIFLSSALFSGISYSGNKTLTEAIAEINGPPITCLKDLNELNAVEINRPSFYRLLYENGSLFDLEACHFADCSSDGKISYCPHTLRPFLTEEEKKISCNGLIKRSPKEVSQYATAEVVAFSDHVMEQHGSDFSKYDKGYLSNKFLLGNLVYMALNCKRPKNKDAALRLLGKFEEGVRGVEDNKLLPKASESRGYSPGVRMAFMRLFGKTKTH